MTNQTDGAVRMSVIAASKFKKATRLAVALGLAVVADFGGELTRTRSSKLPI